MGTYSWAVGVFRNGGTNIATAPGYGGTAFSPGAVGAPSSTSKLVRVGLGLKYHVTGTSPSAIITPDWPWTQEGYVCAQVQPAGSSSVPSPTDPSPVDFKVSAQLVCRPWSFGFATSQGLTMMQTDGLIWSKGEDRTPPGGGLQVRPAFAMNDGSGGTAVFGSSSRWLYDLMLRVLWFTP